eukprot:1252647-Rhodomonas_salina.1
MGWGWPRTVAAVEGRGAGLQACAQNLQLLPPPRTLLPSNRPQPSLSPPCPLLPSNPLPPQLALAPTNTRRTPSTSFSPHQPETEKPGAVRRGAGREEGGPPASAIRYVSTGHRHHPPAQYRASRRRCVGGYSPLRYASTGHGIGEEAGRVGAELDQAPLTLLGLLHLPPRLLHLPPLPGRPTPPQEHASLDMVPRVAQSAPPHPDRTYHPARPASSLP